MGAASARPRLTLPGITLDTGALIAIERADPYLRALLAEAAISGFEIAVPAGVVAQAWRGSSRQARLARFLAVEAVSVIALDEPEARAVGALCANAGTTDIVDASVVICARARDHTVVTSDPGDLAALDPRLVLVSV